VTPDYHAPFPLQGVLERLVFTLGDDREPATLPPYMND